jgi:hypothetical protein
MGQLDGTRGQLDFVKDKQTTQQIIGVLWTSEGTNRQPPGTTRLTGTTATMEAGRPPKGFM